jgi:hypothetical protein
MVVLRYLHPSLSLKQILLIQFVLSTASPQILKFLSRRFLNLLLVFLNLR